LNFRRKSAIVKAHILFGSQEADGGRIVKRLKESFRKGIGMEKKQLQHYKKVLLNKREELLESIKRNPFREDGLEARKGDLADLSDRNSNNVISIHLKETESKLIRAIDEAILRLEKGNYGICTKCGKKISRGRLEAVPWTRLCISCKEEQYK